MTRILAAHICTDLYRRVEELARANQQTVERTVEILLQEGLNGAEQQSRAGKNCAGGSWSELSRH